MAGLGLAVLAEHLTCDESLATIVARMTVTDRMALASDALLIENAAHALREIVAPRRAQTRDTGRELSKSATPDGAVIANRYPGKCKCGRYVTRGRGYAVKIDGKWSVQCFGCKNEESS